MRRLIPEFFWLGWGWRWNVHSHPRVCCYLSLTVGPIGLRWFA